MRIVSWNINSVRIRLENIKLLLEKSNADIVALQETKVQDSQFPIDELKKIGFDYIEFCGEKSYNGVAILSRIPLLQVNKHKFSIDTECRHISAIIPGGIELHNFYIPAGGDIPDISLNPKFDNKLKYLDQITHWFKQNRNSSDKMILLGDLNIAPLEHDVWSHKQLLKEVSHTPIEIEKLAKLKASLDWCDTHRQYVPDSEKLYSWWSYRNRDWRKSDRGRRLDHIWVTPSLKPLVKNAWIMKDARDWTMPSDHVPVLVEI
jgi:exodeoxyribonuclease-3